MSFDRPIVLFLIIFFYGNPSFSNSVDNDVSDFSWDKIQWLDPDISKWAETSRITSVKVTDKDGICIDHTKRGKWPVREPKQEGNVRSEGNPWVIVKLNGRYYAGTYEWLRSGQECKLGHVGGIAKIYDGPDSIGRHVKRPPLQHWIPKGGDVVGFMVSPHARWHTRDAKVRERSNIQWYRLPATDGTGGEMLGSSPSNGGTTREDIILGECNVWRGRSDESCKAGKFHAPPPHTKTEYRWTCQNIPHKKSTQTGKRHKRCSYPKEPEFGVLGRFMNAEESYDDS